MTEIFKNCEYYREGTDVCCGAEHDQDRAQAASRSRVFKFTDGTSRHIRLYILGEIDNGKRDWVSARMENQELLLISGEMTAEDEDFVDNLLHAGLIVTYKQPYCPFSNGE